MSAARELPKLLTVADVARALNLSPRTVRRMIANGALSVVRFGRAVRIRPSTLADLIGAPDAVQKAKQTNDS